MEGGGRLTGGAKMDNRFTIASGPDNGSSVEWTTDVDVSGAARMFISDREIERMVTGMNAGVIACMRREIEGR
jgi:carbon monoxide dehydrogenase subunit G